MMISFDYNGQTVTVELLSLPDGRFRAQIGDREVVFSPQVLPDGGIVLALEGERHTVYVESVGAERQIALDGEVYTLSVPDTRPGRRNVRKAAGDLSAQMPGQVREVRVSEGETVTRGQTILLLEAMKMEIRVAAPADGIVKRLLVKAGDVVERGQRLAEIE